MRDGDGWVLNGAKMFISNGYHGNLYFVAAKTDPEAKGSRGISMFMVERDMPGFRIGRKLEKFGIHCSDTAELIFEDCRVPAKNLLGEENRGFYAVMQNFQNERLSIGAMATAESETALAMTIEHIRNRKAFGGTLSDDSLALMMAEGEHDRYGLGVDRRVKGGHDVVGHTGSTMGFNGELFVDPATGVCVAVQTNDFFGVSEPISDGLWDDLATAGY